ncbi:MAG: hypothetical protein ACR2IE_02980 [Candidatus Sumerlaeaceae bacterium]
MRKEFVFISAAIGLLAVPSFAAPTYGYKSQFNSPGQRMTVATASTTGTIYFCDNNSDKVWMIATPLTATGVAGDFTVVYDASGSSVPPDPYGPGSWEGITIDPNGTIYASGQDATNTYLAKFVQTGPTTWATNLITLPGGLELCGGCTAVGVNKVVLPGYASGSLHFLTVNTGTNTATEDAGSPVTAAGFTGNAPSATYDAAHSRIYISHTVTGTSNGGVHYFTSTAGTPATTSYSGAVNPFVADLTGESSSNSPFYQSVSLNAADNIVMTGRGGNAVGAQGWRLIDGSLTGPNAAHYQFIDGTGSTGGQLPAADAALGHTFFTVSGTKYLITGTEDSPRKYTVYQQTPAAVADWAIYEN